MADELRLFEQAAARTDWPKSKLVVRLSAADHVRVRHGVEPALELKKAIERDFPDLLPRLLQRAPSVARVWRRLEGEHRAPDAASSAARGTKTAAPPARDTRKQQAIEILKKAAARIRRRLARSNR